MSTLPTSLVSSASRSVPVRMRPDLEVRDHLYQGRRYWVLKEPIGLHYHRFEPEEFALLEMLDGRASFEQIQEQFEQQFPPQKISLAEIQQFVGRLHTSGLVISDAPGQGDQLKKRRDEQHRKQLMQSATNVLSMRFKGFDPDPILNAIYPWIRWMFTPAAVLLSIAMAVAALMLIIVQFDVFQSKLPSFHQFFSAQNWLLLACAMAVTKVLHEFGHGLTCKHFKGECHEMGIMLLVLTPCLYCNVSDSWMLPNKWHRAAIGVAGMFVEMIIASICTFLWWFSEPGLLNYLCLSTMFVSSVSTLLFNGNPLLRYDGYYILSDIIEIPNLRQKASSILSRKLGSWCLGLKEPHDPFLPQRHQAFFAVYTVAAAAYRWVVTFSILWFLYKMFEPYRLEIIGQLIGMAAIYGLVGRPLWQVCKFFHVPGRIYQVKRPRMAATLAALGTALAAVLLVPLPSAVYCGLEIKPRDATSVYVDVPGRLSEVLVDARDFVDAGQPLARLINLDVQMELEKLTGQRDNFRTQLDSLHQRRFRDKQAGLEIAQVRESLETVENQLKQKQRDQQRLTIAAPVAGTILPPPVTPNQGNEQGELARWSGTPLESRNLGASLEGSTLFCQVGDPQQLEAILVIDQADIERIRQDQSVTILLDQMAGRTYQSTITEVARTDMKVTSSRLSNKSGGEVATKTDASGRERPLSASYQARVPLDDPEGLLRLGLRGQAKIHANWETLGTRAWRYLSRTFSFEL